jgi:hypothetical protein
MPRQEADDNSQNAAGHSAKDSADDSEIAVAEGNAKIDTKKKRTKVNTSNKPNLAGLVGIRMRGCSWAMG